MEMVMISDWKWSAEPRFHCQKRGPARSCSFLRREAKKGYETHLGECWADVSDTAMKSV